MKFKFTLIAAALTLGSSALAQTKWDLPAAYPASNFHTENLTQFAADVDKASGGKLKITVHANASLFKANEIKRAVQGGQAQIGEVLLVNFENENPIYGLDGLPFLATSYADSKKLYEAQKPALDKLLGAQGMKLLAQATLDRNAIEQVRQTQQQLADQRSRRMTQAFADAAEVLTPAQRVKAAEERGKRGHGFGHKGHGPRHGHGHAPAPEVKP